MGDDGQLRRPWCPATRVLEQREAEAEEAAAEARRRAAQPKAGDGLFGEVVEPPPRTVFPEIVDGAPVYQKNEGGRGGRGGPQGLESEHCRMNGAHGAEYGQVLSPGGRGWWVAGRVHGQGRQGRTVQGCAAATVAAGRVLPQLRRALPFPPLTPLLTPTPVPHPPAGKWEYSLAESADGRSVQVGAQRRGAAVR